MSKYTSEFRGTRRFQARDSLPEPIEVRPHGPFGVGLLTGHPIGIIIVVGIIIMGLVALRPIRLFFMATLPVGAMIGLILWLLHRNN